MTASKRLAKELEKSRFPSIRAFREELLKRFPKVRGRSYSSTHSYFKGGVEPPLEFLEAAAEVFDVPLKHLRTGEGSSVAGVALPGYVDDDGQVDVMALFDSCSLRWFRQAASGTVIYSWFGAVQAILQSSTDMRSVHESPDALLVIGKWLIANATHHPVALNPRGNSWARTRFNQYYGLFFTTMASAAAYPGEGVPLAELVATLQRDIDAGLARNREDADN